jgi:hypothetical protein
MRPNCISLDALRALGPDTITKLASALSIEAKAKASWESATAHVDAVFSEIALKGTAPVVASVPVADSEPIILKPRPQDRSQEAVMPLAQPFDVALPIPSAPAPAEEEATAEGVTPCPPVVVETTPEVATSPPASGADEEWLTCRDIGERLGVKPQRLGHASRNWRCKETSNTDVRLFLLSDAVAYVKAKGWDIEAEPARPTVKPLPVRQPLPKPVALTGPYFEREGVAHYDAIEQGRRKAEEQDWASFYITFDPKSGDVSYIRGRGQATGLNLVERWEKSRGGIWDSQPMGKGLDGVMGAHMHTGAMGARRLG